MKFGMVDNTLFMALVLVLLLSGGVIGQASDLTVGDVRVIRDAAKKATMQTIHRETMSTEEIASNKSRPYLRYGFVKDFVPPDRFHFKFRGQGMGGLEESESIFVSGRSFSRIGKGPWALDPNAASESGSDLWAGDIDEPGPTPTFNAVHEAGRILNGKPVDFYQITKNIKYGP